MSGRDEGVRFLVGCFMEDLWAGGWNVVGSGGGETDRCRGVGVGAQDMLRLLRETSVLRIGLLEFGSSFEAPLVDMISMMEG